MMKVLCLKKNELKLFDRDFRLEDDSISLRHGKYDANHSFLLLSVNELFAIPCFVNPIVHGKNTIPNN